MSRDLDQLDRLEALSVHLLREAYAAFPRLCMLWSIGKDSTVLLWLARKAFFGHVPFPLVHVDTSFKIPEMIQHRDRIALEWRLRMVVGRNDEALQAGRTFPAGVLDRLGCCGQLKTEALRRTLSGEGPRYRMNLDTGRYEPDPDREPYTGVIVGVRADEEGSRSKERYFSPRSTVNAWDVGEQPPSSGTSSRPSSRPGPTSASTRCSIGPSSTSGNTSIGSRSRPSPCTTTRATECATARSAAGPAPGRCAPTRVTRRRSSRSCVPGSSPGWRSAPGGPRIWRTAGDSRVCGGRGTCER